jgi:superfamily II DNA or RNA helicase
LLTVVLSPQGILHVEIRSEDDVQVSDLVAPDVANRIGKAFVECQAAGIVHLATVELNEELPISLEFWRDLGRLFFAHLCALPDLEEKREAFELAPPTDELLTLLACAPPMLGSEYLSIELLHRYWQELLSCVRKIIAEHLGSVEKCIQDLNPAWNLVGRVCFHLAENKQNTDKPFAFLATYTKHLSAKAKAQHVPLSRALQEYSRNENKSGLLTLLRPVQKASENSGLLKDMVDSGDIFQTLAWTPDEAYRFLKDIPVFEAAGAVVRVPNWWQAKRPPRPEVRVTVGNKGPSALGLDALTDFNVSLSLDGELLTDEEWQQILDGASGLIAIKGQWVEIDKGKLSEALEHWRMVQKTVAKDGVSFSHAMRLLAGASRLSDGFDDVLTSSDAEPWFNVAAGDWLAKTLKELGTVQSRREADPGSALTAVLRPYQRAGVEWLWLLHRLRLGACLADDMGLGKTIQILSLLLLLKRESNQNRSLLVVPASLIGNWLSEAAKFAPSLKVSVLHSSSASNEIADADLMITTYGLLSKYPWVSEFNWTLAVLDEAQAIKNPGAKQSAAAKSLKAQQRIALTGTPIENRLSDLWSLFDFICPGLLGTAKVFSNFVKEKDAAAKKPYAAIRNLVRPYILRRLKTDRTIISDLPEKTEIRAYCQLSKVQAGLYENAVDDLKRKIDEVDGIQRRGVILAFLMRFKQICNHPSHWLGESVYEPKDSGKFARLAEICEEIAARQEKVIIFTQFREMTTPIADYLAEIFGRKGLILHGATPVKERKTLVDRFQAEDGPPFFVLSLKAGGVGLNLTAASHVIHFDRWWNPAVENQATDRAFRIGQKKNVLVHKFVCSGTLEEKIDALIEDKKALATELLEGGSEAVLTEMSNADLIKIVSLDINRALDVTQ